jgi:hypothetical protein
MHSPEVLSPGERVPDTHCIGEKLGTRTGTILEDLLIDGSLLTYTDTRGLKPIYTKVWY